MGNKLFILIWLILWLPGCATHLSMLRDIKGLTPEQAYDQGYSEGFEEGCWACQGKSVQDAEIIESLEKD